MVLSVGEYMCGALVSAWRCVHGEEGVSLKLASLFGYNNYVYNYHYGNPLFRNLYLWDTLMPTNRSIVKGTSCPVT